MKDIAKTPYMKIFAGPHGRLKLIRSFKGVRRSILIYRDENSKEFLFKESKNTGNELLAWGLVRVAKIKRVPYAAKYSIKEREGLLLHYLKKSKLLSQHKQKLSAAKLRELQRIVLFDIWIGNKDRHTANILIYKRHLIPLDHERILQGDSKCSHFIKIDVGMKLHPQWPDILEKLKGKNTGEALRELGFKEEDIQTIKTIPNTWLWKFSPNNDVFHFLKFRRDNYIKLRFY